MIGRMEPFDYPSMVRRALRQVVRFALEEAAGGGLGEGRHFFITFQTEAPGVRIPQSLAERFPDTMTIVLQHQFWDLEPRAEGFGVTLAFSGVHRRLDIPYAAIETFVDPVAEFALSFEEREGEATPAADEAGAEGAPDGEGAHEVVRLDDFRKRT